MYGAEKPFKKTMAKVECQVVLADGRSFDGHFFAGAQQRLSDVLNDQRPFLPFATSAGETLLIAKAAIATVTPQESAADDKPAAYRGENPYLLLAVDPKADLATIKRAYHDRIREHHPDRLNGFGLPQEYVDLANQKLSAINKAYKAIVAERQHEPETAY
ncbi:J domain-containing protein [Oceanibacterium hippocampi]|uniref:DnaJ-like protein DjlA n=1 Tax=Oceanibacterium hippocampi TaxID=745714 RepID=A0A1Y5S853_9PROT|nr:DnaJ domain-containing protein [Oceanibacterium hippocampi]SLN32020.1 DnaJ-like protein DjlA [Oceanibacterium hippocampi]